MSKDDQASRPGKKTDLTEGERTLRPAFKPSESNENRPGNPDQKPKEDK